MIDVRVPDEQEGTKAVVRSWLKQVGDAVAENDPLVELETDKVTQEVPAPAAGVLTEIVLDTDAEAVPGALLARISTSAPAQAGAQTEPKGRADILSQRALRATGPLPLQGNGASVSGALLACACLYSRSLSSDAPSQEELLGNFAWHPDGVGGIHRRGYRFDCGLAQV